jgi:SAM-dependent methyltransferase
LKGEFRVADAENLDFADESFDVVYSHGVLHHTPDTEGAIREIHRVLKTGGRAVVMLYHRGSYNYRIGIRVLRRAGAGLLKSNAGIRLVNLVTGEPVDSLREHAALMKASRNGYLSSDEFLSQSTDGAGNPLARVYSRREARTLFRDFREVELRAYFLNKTVHSHRGQPAAPIDRSGTGCALGLAFVDLCDEIIRHARSQYRER